MHSSDRMDISPYTQHRRRLAFSPVVKGSGEGGGHDSNW